MAEQRWTIKKSPRRSFGGVIVQGPDTDWIEVMPVSEAERWREALRELVECFDGFDDDGQPAVMNETMPWEDVVPRVEAARSALVNTEPDTGGER